MRNILYAAAVATLLSGCAYVDALIGPETQKKYVSIESIVQCPDAYEGQHLTVRGIPEVQGMSFKPEGYMEVDIAIHSMESRARLVSQNPLRQKRAMSIRDLFSTPRTFDVEGDMRQGRFSAKLAKRGQTAYSLE